MALALMFEIKKIETYHLGKRDDASLLLNLVNNKTLSLFDDTLHYEFDNPWKEFYFLFEYSRHNQFPIDLLSLLSSKIYTYTKSNKSNHKEVIAASAELLYEVASISLESNKKALTSRNSLLTSFKNYQKRILKNVISLQYPSPSIINLSFFEKAYLKLLRDTSSDDYGEFLNSLVWKKLSKLPNILTSFPTNLYNNLHSFSSIRTILTMFFNDIINMIKFSTFLFINFFPLTIVLLVIGVALIAIESGCPPRPYNGITKFRIKRGLIFKSLKRIIKHKQREYPFFIFRLLVTIKEAYKKPKGYEVLGTNLITAGVTLYFSGLDKFIMLNL